MSPSVLYEDRDLIACVKPHGIPSQPDPSHDTDMTALLRDHISLRGETGNVFVIHRLDRVVGGVILYAKNSRAASELSRTDSFEKTYLAIVSGVPNDNEGTFEDFIYRDARLRKAFTVSNERRDAKRASLEYRVLAVSEKEEKKFSLLQIKLHTGRFHQIRVQLASRGYPICGDGKYGSREKCVGITLWAHSLSFEHKKKQFRFSQLPDANAPFWNLFDLNSI